MKKNLNPAINKELRNKVVLITGGAGSIGSEIAKTILKYPVKTVRILDINEHALFKLKRSINDDRLKFLLGDILDNNRVEMAMNYADIIINAAAIKNIEISEFNPIETINVNINGIINLIQTSIRTKPKKFLNISTDKVADASTLYGTTKQLGERLTSWAGAHIQSSKFASVRLGNVMETRGNVFEIWKEEAENNIPLSITDPKMERYYFHVNEAVDFILDCIVKMKQGEIFIPKMKSYKMIDLASKYSKKHKIIGLRQGEKLNEILMTESEKEIAKEEKNMWIIKIYERGIYLL
jgi:FlaA1/EpsC-like NDP-sugar epimerase